MSRMTSKYSYKDSAQLPKANYEPSIFSKFMVYNASGLFRKTTILSEEKFKWYMNELTKQCLSHNPDTYKIHISRRKGLSTMRKILNRADRSYITYQHLVQMVWCMLSCIHHFQIRLCQFRGRFACRTWRLSHEALVTFDELVMAFPDMEFIILKSIIKFFKEAKLWGNEFMSHDLLLRFLYLTSDRSAVIFELIMLCEEYSTQDSDDSRDILRIIDKIFEDFPWGPIEKTLLERMFNLFFSSIESTKEVDEHYVTLHKGLEICLRHVVENLNNTDLMIAIRMLLKWAMKQDLDEQALLEIGSMLEYAAMNYQTTLYSDSLPNDVIGSLVKLISSPNMLQSLLGNRVLHYLIDRSDNRLKFDTPRIFYEHSQYTIVVNVYHEKDKLFFQKHREAFHSSILTSIVTHGMRQINLESSYTLIALLMVEVPCPYTAAAGVCLAMAIQEATFQHEDLTMNQAHRFHATVMSIMSLICYIYSAEVFYQYLNTIIDRRAEFAPHLNPPLKRVYEYNQHHVHWDKPELFFEDWEIRYGLWKCFKRDFQP